MDPLLPWLVLSAPALLIATALWGAVASPRARTFATLAIAAATLGFAACLAAATGVAVLGPGTTAPIGIQAIASHGIGVSLRLDALAVIMLAPVGFVGLVVVRYSRNYLDGDPGQVRFTCWLLVTLAAVLTLLVAGNVALLIAAWIATGLALNRLLLFYPERPAAQRAARKKFAVSRVGDVCLVLAAWLLHSEFGTLEISAIVSAARQMQMAGGSGASASLQIAALLIVTTAMLKSAQLPLHGWLIEVMETPTPVSALLHAGIVNAGGFLVLRLADVLVLAAPALEVLAVVGALTALFGSLAMLTQPSIKVQLAYSTVAQMGFMLLQCGLGAFSYALLHIVAHSLYKAHAFLSSGSVMDLARASWTPSPGEAPHPARLVLALAGVAGLTVAAMGVAGVAPAAYPAQIVLGAIVLMGLVHLLASAIDKRPAAFVVGRAVGLAFGVAGLYVALQAGMKWLVAASLPVDHAATGPVETAIAAFAILAFGAVTVFQSHMMRHAAHPVWTALYVHLRNGLYLNTLANRLVLALWPRRAAPAAS